MFVECVIRFSILKNLKRWKMNIYIYTHKYIMWNKLWEKIINFSPYGLYVSYLQYYAWCAMPLNDFTCKDPKMVEASDFSISGLHIAGNTSNPAGSKVSTMTSTQISRFWHFPCTYWLRTIEYQPSPHSPSCNRNLNCLGR